MADAPLAYLSPDWVAALAAAADDATVATAATALVAAGGPLRITTRVDEAAWHLVVTDAGVTVGIGPAPSEHDVAGGGRAVEIAQDRRTAESIARGALGAQRAFIDGRLVLRGRGDDLVRAQTLFEVLDRAWAPVRERTRYDDPAAIDA